MMRKLLFVTLIFWNSSAALAQDSLYTRSILKTLCSEKCFGRGYVRNGLKNAQQYIVREIKAHGGQPLFGKSYTQAFKHPVNTFPKNVRIVVNSQELEIGRDVIPGADNPSVTGTCSLQAKDSVTYTGSINGVKILLKLSNKLTYTVARSQSPVFSLEIDRNKFKSIPASLSIDFQNKFEPGFTSKNIACKIPGKSLSDSTIVFTAHYDHLGGIGRSCYFPGANDNASGVSMLLNLLAYYQLHPPKYTTLFVFFAGEEAGLLGSEYFVKHSPITLSNIKFLINLDLLGTGDDGIMVVNGAVFTKEFERLQTLNNTLSLLPQVKKRGKAANSDHYWFSENNVPAFFIYTMGGITAYHDIYDREATLPLTKYKQVYNLLLQFVEGF